MASLKIKPTEKKRKILPLVLVLGNRILNELQITEHINRSVEWDKARWKISPGALLKALVLSTLFDLRSPLTRIQRRFEGIDISYLLGEEVEDGEINETNIGRALERLGQSDYNGLYETLALSAVQQNNIPMNRLHADTTTISFYGEYEDAENELNLTDEEKQALLRIERGYNKDGRPQCNQVVVGQVVNETGIPIISRTMNGSTSDVAWNKEAIEHLERILGDGFRAGIFVADSKLITDTLVRRMTNPDQAVRFVSRCPANFADKLESRTIAEAYKADSWECYGSFHEGKQASVYHGQSFTQTVCDSPMRLLVLRSSSLEEKAENAIIKGEEALRPLIQELEKKEFACLPDAEEAVRLFLNSKQMRLFQCEYEIKTVEKVLRPKGRPKKDAQPAIKESFRIHITGTPRNAAACAHLLHTESCIVLISNDHDVDDRTLLQTYKGQQVVENSFRLLKEPQLASVIYLKSPVRIKALSMLLSLSLLMRAIIQYKMRDGLKQFQEDNPGIELRVGWKDRPLSAPTFKLFYEHALNCRFEQEGDDEYSLQWENDATAYRVSTLLLLMGMTVETLFA